MDTFWGLSSGENLVLLYTNNKGAVQTAQSGQSPCYSLSSKMITKLDLNFIIQKLSMLVSILPMTSFRSQLGSLYNHV